MRRMLAAWIAIGLALGPLGTAQAEEGTGQTEAAARFERGLELYEDGALDAALAEFERAYELTLDARVLYNIGHVQSQRHRYVEAIEAFERYLKGATVNETRRAQVDAELEKLRARIGRLSLESNVSGAQVFVNGVSVGAFPLAGPVPVNPGVCEVRVEKPGYQTARETLTIAGGDTPRLVIHLLPAGADLTPPAESSALVTPRTRYNYTPFWISAASTLVLGGGTAVMGVLALDKEKQLKDELGTPPSDPDRVEGLRNDGKIFAGVTDGLAAATVIAGGLSIYFLVDPPKKSRRVGASSLRITAGPGQAIVSGRF
jgi:tetratricopeptide (TPR) repeat protein